MNCKQLMTEIHIGLDWGHDIPQAVADFQEGNVIVLCAEWMQELVDVCARHLGKAVVTRAERVL